MNIQWSRPLLTVLEKKVLCRHLCLGEAGGETTTCSALQESGEVAQAV